MMKKSDKARRLTYMNMYNMSSVLINFKVIYVTKTIFLIELYNYVLSTCDFIVLFYHIAINTIFNIVINISLH